MQIHGAAFLLLTAWPHVLLAQPASSEAADVDLACALQTTALQHTPRAGTSAAGEAHDRGVTGDKPIPNCPSEGKAVGWNSYDDACAQCKIFHDQELGCFSDACCGAQRYPGVETCWTFNTLGDCGFPPRGA
eukprot:CAMPEP_0179167802 /NCGR_PEP_ID=MMETSP0796-20121207/82522_1 /TAXON_ID=73915 /ORGANISM="Pyrodinium bahamense, Strain pbaha01" /LENGTH=131 /DNA_ID=CAMNT_0020870533 /DNA_START=60 /DNA_END=455 /DNA_ORIENTATION=-